MLNSLIVCDVCLGSSKKSILPFTILILLRENRKDRGLQGALMELKVEYRTVIVLKHVMGCSYEEIGVVLDCPVKTVKSRLFTARQALRDVLVARGMM